MTYLRAFAHGWALHSQNQNAEAIIREAKTLVERLSKFGDHFAAIGGSLEGTVKHWNAAVGFFDGRLLPTAQRIGEMSGRRVALEREPLLIDTAIRPVQHLDSLPQNARDVRDAS